MIQANTLIAREEARTTLRELCLRVPRDRELCRLIACDELAGMLVHWLDRPRCSLDMVAGSVDGQIK